MALIFLQFVTTCVHVPMPISSIQIVHYSGSIAVIISLTRLKFQTRVYIVQYFSDSKNLYLEFQICMNLNMQFDKLL